MFKPIVLALIRPPATKLLGALEILRIGVLAAETLALFKGNKIGGP